LKYATLASYLEPRPSDIEIIEAIRQHFPITVQRAMLGNQLKTVQETLDLLKRVEIMEGSDAHRGSNPAPFQQNPPEDRRNTNHQNYNRYRDTQDVRNIQHDRYHQGNYDQRNNRGRQAYYQDWRRRNDSPPRQRIETLNPNAPTFLNNRDREETEVVRRNPSEQGNRD
jgi:Ni/Co efflux regulator RcnB